MSSRSLLFVFAALGVVTGVAILAHFDDDRRQAQVRYGAVEITALGAKCDGTNDDTAAIEAALASASEVRIPAGTCVVSASVVLTRDGHRLVGAGPFASKITTSKPLRAVIEVAPSLRGWSIADLSVVASEVNPAAIGIDARGPSDQARIQRVYVASVETGVALGPTGYSTISDSWIEECSGDGVLLTNSAHSATLQWQVINVLAQKNGGYGLRVLGGATEAHQLTMGTWTNIATYANSAGGAGFFGSKKLPIQGIRLVGGFLGEDGGTEIYMDTYGEDHSFTGVRAELAGAAPTGNGLQKSPSKTGDGIRLTLNNGLTTIEGGHFSGNSLNGIRSSARRLLITGAATTNNGSAESDPVAAGVRIDSGVASVLVISGNRTGALQKYGLYRTVPTVTDLGSQLFDNATADRNW